MLTEKKQYGVLLKVLRMCENYQSHLLITILTSNNLMKTQSAYLLTDGVGQKTGMSHFLKYEFFKLWLRYYIADKDIR